jgi:hypothetical protein
MQDYAHSPGDGTRRVGHSRAPVRRGDPSHAGNVWTGGQPSPTALLSAQRTAGNRAVARLLIQRSHITVQRDWTGDRADEVHAAMTGVDWNRPSGPWFLLNGHNPEALVGILRKLGPRGRQKLAAHPVDGGRYDKPRLDFALAHAASSGTTSQLGAMDAIRAAIKGSVKWEDCWATVLKLSRPARAALYGGMDHGELRALLEHVDAAAEPAQPALEAEIDDAIAPPVKDILLDFIPDASELPDDKGHPEPLGKITVLLKDKPVMDVPARGGPWKSYKDKRNPGHTADPTAAGTFTLAAGSAIVTSAWPYSQLANGTPIRDTGTDVEFLRSGRWISVTKLAKPLDRDSVMQMSARVELQRQVFSGTLAYADVKKKWDAMKASNDFTPLAPTWQLNDFGKEGFRILGTPGDIVHTTPETDDEAESLLTPGNLSFSHGCVHLLGPDRQKLIENGYLRAGVRIKIHPYNPVKLSRWGDPKE